MATYYENVTALAPKVWFKFNETSGTPVNSGSATCTLSGGTGSILGENGVVNKSIKFPSTGAYSFSQVTNVMNDKSFTIEMWHKAPTSGTPNQYLLQMGSGVSSNAIWIEWFGSTANATPGKYKVSFRGGAFGSGAVFYELIPSVTFTENEWHHIAFTVSTSAIILYVDGVNVASQSNPTFATTVDFDGTQYRTLGSNMNGWLDEIAIYGETLTSQQVYNNYYSAFNTIGTAEPFTASALAINPAVSINSILTSTPATASAASGDHYNSTRDGFTTLNTYLSTLPLEQWYKFDEVKKIVNYGTGGTASMAFGGNSTSEDFGGIQGSGALRITGSVNDGAVYQILNDLTMITPEITDGDFSVGFWVKANSAVADNNCEIWNAVNTTNNRFNRFAINNSGKLSFQMQTNTIHTVETTGSICDNQWHFVVGKYNQSRMYLYVDGTLIGDTAVNYNNFSPPNVMNFGSNGTAATGDFFSVSQFFISSFSAITTTVITNIINAAQGEFQAYANMETPKISFNNSFNDLTETRGALVDLRFNEASGAPVNFGTTSGVSFAATGGNITYGQLSPNTKAYRITNTNAKISAVHEFPAGTFTTNNSQTLMAYVKIDTGTAPAVINFLACSGHLGGDYGSGLGLIMVPGGAFRARLRNGAGFETITTSTTYADSQYHLVAATTDGSTLKLYVDGVEMGSTSTTRALTDKILLMVGGEADTFGATNQSKSTFVDEVSVYNYAFTAEQIFNHFQAVSQQMDWTATSLFVDPTYSAGFGPIIVETPMTASAELPNVFPFIPPMTGDGLFQVPNFEAIDNVINIVDPMEASAQGENPGWDIGENNQVLHMDATASFPDPRVLIPGKWNASPAIAIPAEMVDPAVVTTLGALIKADALPANAFFQLPPAYYLITDDLWYQRLLEIDYQSESANGLITFFNTSSDIYLGGSYDGWNARNVRSPLQSNYGYNLYDVPLPVGSAGYFDTTNRKALNLRNIALEKGDRETPVATWTMELMIQTTKKNQFITSAFYGGNPASSVSRKNRTGIRLKDGKIAFTGLVDSTLGMLNSNSEIQFTGFKDIADGEWHHVIIQRRGDGVDQYNPRMQVWIDGKLDIQRFGAFAYCPGQIGYNSNDPDAYSDFNISAISINRGSFVLEREIILNYLASFNIIPVKAPAAFATAEIGQDSKAAGNRPRALMLYFWPTTAEQGSARYTGFTSTESADVLTTLDYFTKPPQDYEGWDVFPVDVTGQWVSDLVKVEAYGGVGNIGTTNFIKDVTPYGRPELADIALFNTAGTFRDPVTDAARYIDLINDIDLSKFDMIMFKNYPNESREKDSFSGEEVVDAYFNLRESKLFADFLKTLRAAVDTGLSLMVATPQLALDLKIVDRVEIVPDMDDNVATDPYAPTQMFGIPGAASLPTYPEYDAPLGWYDTWKNNRTRIVNTHPDITDYPAVIKTQQAFWRSTDEYRWGGADRVFMKYEHKDALAVGDEFVISTTGQRADKNQLGYFATPFENVKAGKIITAFANTVRRGLDEIDNPYKNYAQTIILEPGDVLDGTQVGGKIFVNFTEEINKTTEGAQIELTSVYWINYAYENGAIDLAARDELLAQSFVTTETPYWSLNGMNLLQQRSGDFELDTDVSKSGIQKEKVKTRKVNKNGGISFQSVPSGSVFFSSVYSWQYPLAGFEMPSMPTRGFRWLSNREVLEGTVLRPQSFVAEAQIPEPAVVTDKEVDFKAQASLATADIRETQFSSGERQVLALPMTATADIVKPGSTIGAPPMRSNASMFDNSRSNVASEDQVVLYLIHVDPILYIREDVIK
jgi:hypothetical protein